MKFEIILADTNNPDHIRAIKRLWDNNLHYIGGGRFEWLYRNNPAGDTVTCLAICKETGKIIGTASAMRRNFYLKGECYTAGIAIDFAIDAEYRVFGPALQLQRSLVEQAWKQGLDFMLGFPNLASQGILKRLGYKCVGESVRFSLLMRTRSKFAIRLADRHLPVWLARPAAAMLDVGLLLRNRLGVSSGTTRVLSSMGEIDDLWRKIGEGNITNRFFQGKHDMPYIRWRYQQCPYIDYQLFGLFDNRQNLVAFLVFSIKDDVVLVDDFRYLDEKWLPSLFNGFWKTTRPTGNVAINIGLLVNGKMKEMMIKLGFTTRKSKRWGGVLSNPSREMNWKQILEAGDWFITDGEIDL